MTQTPIGAVHGESKRAVAASQPTADTGSATTSLAGCDSDVQRRSELAMFLKMKRAAVAPHTVGLQPGRRRRANGLLREEVAQRAGISPTWYTWLEQGREINPSAEVLEQLAAALLLTAGERTHLLTLARPNAAARTSPRFSQTVPDVLVSWLQGLDQPAYALKRLRHADLGLIDLTYAPLRPRGVADDVSVSVYSPMPVNVS